ncbi:MAG: hypothetical protein EOO04_11400 [Chitinophagaceae bacterium]|nr:MAG: hypothetical protein EOO04_11400 [Chitinophagaceae bacterium]
MKRLLRSLLLCSLLTAPAVYSKAQFNMGAGLAFNTYKGKGYKKAHPALQARLGYDLKSGKYFVNAGYNFSPSVGRTTAYFSLPNSSGIMEEYYLQQQIRINNAFLHFGYVLFPAENDFHLRLIFGASMDFINIGYEFDDNLPANFDKSWYSDTTMTGAKIDVGIGADFKIGSGKLFAELMLGLPANTVNDMPYANPTVGHKGFIIGYSYYFGGRRDWY